MKRTWIMLLAVAMALVIALPAGAVKPDKPDKPEPKPEGGYTCAEYYGYTTSDPVDFGSEGGSFTLDIVNREVACVDVIAPAGDWKVTVNDAIGVRRVTIRVQDSVAGGDVCGIHVDPEENMILGALADGDFFTLEGIQDAHVNACGTDWAEWIDGDLRTDVASGEAHPLAFLVFGGRGTFTITVTVPGEVVAP